MAAGLILQFPGVTEQDYDAVNSQLRFDPRTGAGEWPAGLQSHSAGASGDGWVVTEIWESKEAQAAFMQRLRLYRLALYLSLIAGPLCLLDGNFPDREPMMKIAEVNTDRVLACLR